MRWTLGLLRIRVEVEGGGRKLIRVADDGQGMSRDDALLAFERHATSKLRTADDLLSIATLGFRGEALPSIASVARVTLETATRRRSCGNAHRNCRRQNPCAWKTRLCPAEPRIAVSDLFFNTPARRKFLRAESTELAHVTALVTHYALAHPEKHFELVSASHTIVSAPPVTRTAERIYQIFGKETLGQLLPLAAEAPLAHVGLPEPPPWKKNPGRPATPARHIAAQRLLFEARTAKAESQFDLHLREQAPHPRPAAAARDHGGLSQRDSAHQLPGGAFVSGDAARRGRRERASGQNRGALSPAEPGSRFCARQFAHGAHQGAARGRFPGRARLSALGQPVAHASGNFTDPGASR